MEQSIALQIIKCFQKGNKVLICGNGGSATMAQHFAGEFVGKYLHHRRPLPALSLTSETATITAIANDYGYESIFERQVEALGNKGDILITLSTSGKSKNVINATKAAEVIGMDIIDFPREGSSTPEIQENQLKLIHKVCKIVEEAFL